MKNQQRGFIGMAILVLAVLAAIGGGAYVYSQNQNKESEAEDTGELAAEAETDHSTTTFKGLLSKPNVETQTKTFLQPKTVSGPVSAKTSVPVAAPKAPVKATTVNASTASTAPTASTASAAPKTLKTFTHIEGIYSASYPGNWTYKQDRLAVRFQTEGDSVYKSFLVNLAVYDNSVLQTLSSQSTAQQVVFGKNIFTKYTKTLSSNKVNVMYVLPIGSVDGKAVYLSILLDSYTSINISDFNSFLGSIKADSSKISVVPKIENEVVVGAQIKANVANIRANAALYYDSADTYAGLCDISSEKVKSSGVSTIWNFISTLVSAKDIYCNASTNAFVYSVRLPSGGVACSDNTGFSDTISTNVKALSCK